MENKKEQSTASSLLRFAGPYKGKYILSIFLSVLGVASGLVPYYAAAQMLIGLIGDEREFSFYLMWGAVAAIGYIAKSCFSILSTSVSHTATFHALRDVRKQIVDKLNRMPMGTLLDTPSGQLKDILVDRVEGLETPLAHLLPEMSANVLVPIFIIVYLFVLDWRMALISLITVPVGMAFMATILKTYPQQYEGSVKINQQMNNAVVEYVNGIEVIKAFNQSAASYGKYSDAVRENASYFYNWMKSCQWAMASYNAICPAVLITVLPAGVLFYAAGSITAANLITIIILSLGIVGPLIAASNFADSLGAVGTVVGEIATLLDGPELVRPVEPVKLDGEEICLHDVSFSYKENGDNVPQAFIIPISVVFRFIPTLGEESAAITDAMRMRGIQFGTKKFWQAPTAILEYRVVPLILSVVKIGDELSAAALTRGLGGLKHRTTISNIGFTFCDAIIALLSVGLLIWALLWGGVLS